MKVQFCSSTIARFLSSSVRIWPKAAVRHPPINGVLTPKLAVRGCPT
jgi:hypothetical protein